MVGVKNDEIIWIQTSIMVWVYHFYIVHVGRCPTVPFNLSKHNSISNKTDKNLPDLDFNSGLHLNRYKPSTYVFCWVFFLSLRPNLLFPEKITKISKAKNLSVYPYPNQELMGSVLG